MQPPTATKPIYCYEMTRTGHDLHIPVAHLRPAPKRLYNVPIHPAPKARYEAQLLSPLRPGSSNAQYRPSRFAPRLYFSTYLVFNCCKHVLVNRRTRKLQSVDEWRVARGIDPEVGRLFQVNLLLPSKLLFYVCHKCLTQPLVLVEAYRLPWTNAIGHTIVVSAQAHGGL